MFPAIQHAWCWQQHVLLFCKGVELGVPTSARATNWECSCQVTYLNLSGESQMETRETHNEELHYFHSSPHIIRTLKQRGLKVWASSMNWGHGICTEVKVKGWVVGLPWVAEFKGWHNKHCKWKILIFHGQQILNYWPKYKGESNENLNCFVPIYWTQKVHNDFIFLCSIVLPPVSHSSNHEYHCCQLTRQSSCSSNFYRSFKVFIWLSLTKENSTNNCDFLKVHNFY